MAIRPQAENNADVVRDNVELLDLSPKTFVLVACLVHVNGDMLHFCWTRKRVLSGRSLQ
jgi:hypothetical protein